MAGRNNKTLIFIGEKVRKVHQDDIERSEREKSQRIVVQWDAASVGFRSQIETTD